MATKEQNSGSIPAAADIGSWCEKLLQDKIDLGFHAALNQPESVYRARFAHITQRAIRTVVPNSQLVVVETRLSPRQQAGLRGFRWDEAVFYEPKSLAARRPYVAWTKIVSGRDGSPGVVVSGLEGRQRAGSIYEGLSLPENVLTGSYTLATPGGEYKRTLGVQTGRVDRACTLAVERFLGGFRVTHYYQNTSDALVDTLVVVG